MESESNIEEMDFDLSVTCSILKDDIQIKDKSLKVIIADQDQERTINPGQVQKITLKRSSKLKGLARSKIHPSWIISWGISLDLSENL